MIYVIKKSFIFQLNGKTLSKLSNEMRVGGFIPQ